MERNSVLASLLALSVVASLGVGAGLLGSSLPGPDSVDSEPGDTGTGSGATSASAGTRPTGDGGVPGCLVAACGSISLHALVGGALDGIGLVPLAGVLALCGVALVVVGFRPHEADTDGREGGSRSGDAGGHDGTAYDFDAPLDNEVHRTWRRLTDAVTDDEAATPREVARAAAEQGFDPEAVADLRRLFVAVRYGDAAPTADRESRAEAALETARDGGERE